jgi:transposase
MSFIRKRKRNGKIYLEEVESVRVNGKVKQKHIKYIGKEADGKTILSSSISDVSIKKIKIYGPLLILNHICNEIGLPDLLGEFSNEILSMVYAHCMDYKSVNQMSRWFERTDLNMILALKHLTESRLLKALDSIELQDQEKLQQDIFQQVKSIYQLDVEGIIYDVTNTYFHGKKCPLAKIGKDKEGVKGRPLIQIGLGVTREDGIPLFHKTFDGNISDSRTLHDLITSFKAYDIESGIVVYDRGITSANNLKAVKELKWHTICGLPINNKLKLEVKSIIEQNKLIDIKRRIKLNQSIFYVYSKDYTIGESNGVLLICYNEQKNKDLRESRYDEIQHAKELIEKGKTIKPELMNYFNKEGALNHKEISKAEEYDGFSFVFSTKKLTINEIMSIYFNDKDIVEKAFQSLKGIVKVRPIRHWLYNRVQAHVFICYLSYLLLSILRMKLKKINITPVEALKEVDSLYKVYLKDERKGFELEKIVTLTKKQEKILKTIDKSLFKQCSG